MTLRTCFDLTKRLFGRQVSVSHFESKSNQRPSIFSTKLGYPRLHSSDFVKRELIANYSLLYTVSGSDKSLKPYMLCAHLDVVPVEEDKWTVDPFQGVIRDGFIYGRGTIDVKDSLMVQ